MDCSSCFRYVLANTEKLHVKIDQMGDRIRALEDALELLQKKHSSDPHPLLRQDLLLIKLSLELYGLDAPAQNTEPDPREDSNVEIEEYSAKRDSAEAVAREDFFGITASPQVGFLYVRPSPYLTEFHL